MSPGIAILLAMNATFCGLAALKLAGVIETDWWALSILLMHPANPFYVAAALIASVQAVLSIFGRR